MFAQKDTIRVLGVEDWFAHHQDAGWLPIQAAVSSGCAVFSYYSISAVLEVSIHGAFSLSFRPACHRTNGSPTFARFHGRARGRRTQRRLSTLEIALHINTASDIPAAAAALAATFPQVQSLRFKFRPHSSDAAARQAVVLDPATVAKALSPFARLQRLYFLSSGNEDTEVISPLSLAGRVELAERTRVRAARICSPSHFRAGQCGGTTTMRMRVVLGILVTSMFSIF